MPGCDSDFSFGSAETPEEIFPANVNIIDEGDGVLKNPLTFNAAGDQLIGLYKLT